ncbi:MAG: hypothetical protein SFX18_14875 [Pirellulales bacterium]|nr:hypothetical protein [Pirellulales bacterium]
MACWLGCCAGCHKKVVIEPKNAKKSNPAKSQTAKSATPKSKSSLTENGKQTTGKQALDSDTAPVAAKNAPAKPKRESPDKHRTGFSASRIDPDFAGPSASRFSQGSFAPAGSNFSGLNSDGAFDKIEAEIRDAAMDGQVLVVFVADRSAGLLLSRAAGRMERLLGGGTDTAKNISAAVVAFGDTVQIVTAQPVKTSAELEQALSGSGGGGTEGKLAYAGVAAACDAFAKFRQTGQTVIMVLLANEALPDETAFETAAATLKKSQIPVYGFGGPLPLFSKDWSVQPGKPIAASWGLEHITLYTPARVSDVNYTDGGFGNFGLERICRASTGGKFFRTAGGGSGWATEPNGDIKAELLRHYAPDYVSEAEYQRLNSQNKARQALLDAAKLTVDAEFEPPVLTFLAGEAEDPARFANALSAAQRQAAKPEFEIEKIYNTLAAGESDKAKLTSKRWEAAYLLALGRAAAALARTKGYNKMLAQLKSGKSFADPKHNTWELVPAENFSGDSQLNGLAKKSRESLKIVVERHPGTPWADIAAKELQSPCGWEWVEK